MTTRKVLKIEIIQIRLKLKDFATTHTFFKWAVLHLWGSISVCARTHTHTHTYTHQGKDLP